MPLNSSSKTALTLVFSLFLIVVVLGYAIFSARHLIQGPQINVTSLKDGDVVTDPFVTIKGTTENINYISLNDRQIYIDSEGNFTEKLLLYDGYNIIKLYGKDKFNREKNLVLRIMVPESTSKQEIATTTILTASSSPPEATSSKASTTSTTSLKNLQH